MNGLWEIVELDESLFTWHWTGLRDIDMVDAENGWAVGYGLIFRYESGQWSVDLDLPPGSSDYSPGSEYTFETISMASMDDGWAGGYDGLLFRYEDGVWTRWDDPLFDSVAVMDIHAIRPGEAWAVGYREGAGRGDSPYDIPRIWHYVDERWQEIMPPIEEGRLSSVRMIDSDEGWAVGWCNSALRSDCSGSIVLHYAGGQWKAISPPLERYGGLESVDVGSQGRVWIGGWGFHQYLPPGNWQHIGLEPAGVWRYD